MRQLASTSRTVAGAIALGIVLCCASAQAQEYGAAGRARRPMAARNEEDATAAGTELVLTDRPIALETTAEALREVPGVSVIQNGPYGGFSGVRIRGGSMGHTAWVFEDVPLSSVDGGGFDLSTLPLPLLQRLEIYRGGAPLWISQGALGGVIRAVTPVGEGARAEVSAGGGSFGRFDARANASASSKGRVPVSQFSVLHVAGAKNNYPYLDDGGTVGKPEDDVEANLRNAQTLDAAGLSHTRVHLPVGRLDLIGTGFQRIGGQPGPGGHSNARDTHRKMWRALGVLSYTLEDISPQGVRNYRLQALGSVTGERRLSSDPLGELAAGPTFRDDQSLRGWGRVAASYAPHETLELTLLGSHARSRYDATDLVSGASRASYRNTTSGAGEVRLHGAPGGVRMELRPSLLVMHSEVEIPIVRVSRPGLRKEAEWLPVTRVGAALEPAAGWTLRSSVSNGGRLPSALELFGEAPYVVGNRELESESGWSWDGGVVVEGRAGPARGQLEALVFWQGMDDLIRFVRTVNEAVTARNIAHADVWGVEAGVDGGLGEHLRSVVALTVSLSEDQNGRELPLLPRARVFARQEVPWQFEGPVSSVVPYVSIDYVGLRYQDAANLIELPARTRLGAGLRLSLFRDRIDIAARAEDLLDARGLDNTGHPLPGRSVFVSLTLKEDLS